MTTLRACLALMLGLSLIALPSAAREWRSADGKGSISATFVRLEGNKLTLRSPAGKDSALPLTRLAADDIAFAQAAQRIADVAIKAGPRHYELVQPLGDLWLCRMGKEMTTQKGLVIYTGELFVLHPSPIAAAQPPSDERPGARLKAPTLYPATQRDYHPLKGQVESITAYTTDIEQAAALNIAWATTPPEPVYEPLIEQVSTLGIGYIIAPGGIILADESLVTGADKLILHIGREAIPATILGTDADLGLALLTCPAAAALAPIRLGSSSKALALGQPIFAIHLSSSDDRKTFADPTLTRGIISRLTGPNGEVTQFQHDAQLPQQQQLGTIILSDKGEPIGLLAGTQIKPSSKGKAKPPATAEPALSTTLGTSLRIEAIADYLQTLPNIPAPKTSPTTSDFSQAIDTLRHSIILITSTREVRREPQRKATKPSPTTGPAAAPATGFSLSKAGTRHTATCRFYNPHLPGAATDGKPCKVCGG